MINGVFKRILAQTDKMVFFKAVSGFWTVSAMKSSTFQRNFSGFVFSLGTLMILLIGKSSSVLDLSYPVLEFFGLEEVPWF